MKTSEINMIKIEPTEGYWLTNKQRDVYTTKPIYLSSNDSVKNWEEVGEEDVPEEFKGNIESEV